MYTEQWQFLPFFNATRSVAQGSPISSFLFLLCSQVLHNLITENENIQGITLYDLKVLISQFADDTTLYLGFDANSINEVIKTLDIVYYNIGLTVNYDKTNIYRIGSLAGSSAQLYTQKVFVWTNEPVSTRS